MRRPTAFDFYGHLFPDESDKLADALDAQWESAANDSSRQSGPERPVGPQGWNMRNPTALVAQGCRVAPGVGLEPTTNGLTARSGHISRSSEVKEFQLIPLRR